MIGKTLAHYHILEKLGSGGMGDVYRARDTKLGRDVAIKVLPAEFSSDPERRKRFAREAQAIAALKHPNIVTIHSVEETDGAHYITMEYVEGETLAARIPKGGLPLEKFFEYAIALADAVSSAHEDGITHRDLKPANVMFDKKGRLKVLDFGLAKLLAPDTDLEHAKTMAEGTDTAVGQILGTAAYMSPEQAEGKPIDHRSDIFSLGIMFYQMATGERPFKGDTHISTISSILKDNPPHISEIRQTLPRHLGRIVNHCLEKNPDKRFQSAKDIRNDLEGLKKEVDSGELSQTMTSAPSLVIPRQPRRWILPTIGAAVAVIAVAAYFVVRLSAPSNEAGASFTFTTTASSTRTPPADRDRAMTVVLPFENLGPPEDAYFAAGVTGEITSRLAAVSGLGVISRTSATQYDRRGKTIGQIGDDLGVDYVLEGTVQWAKRGDGTDRVRITPQLIRVTDDVSVWSNTYDRELDDIFEVQTEIATEVINQLGVTLLGSEREIVADAPTENMEAYRLYLQAKELPFFDDPVEWDREYVELMEKAVELDPQFVDAWAELSMHHSSFYAYPIDRTDERRSRARRALQEAEAIDGDHFRTHLARGAYHYYGFQDYDQALEEFLAATRIVPNEAKAREMVAYIYRRQGKFVEALENMRAAFELNPEDDNIAYNLARTYDALREYEESVRFHDRAIAIDPKSYYYVMSKAYLAVRYKGDLDEARKILGSKPDGGLNLFAYHIGWTYIYFYDREYSRALEQVSQIEEPTPFFHIQASHLKSTIEAIAGGPDRARASLEETNREIEALLETMPDSDEVRRTLAANLALLGRGAAAIREAKLAIEQTKKDRFSGPMSLQTLAEVYTLTGRHDEAIDLLEQLLETAYEEPVTPSALELDPKWDSLREYPRFQALLPKPNI